MLHLPTDLALLAGALVAVAVTYACKWLNDWLDERAWRDVEERARQFEETMR